MSRAARPIVVGVLLVLAGIGPLALSGATAAQPLRSAAAEREPESVVSAQATARVSRTPDYMEVVLGVVVQNASPAAASEEAARKMEATLAALKALNLEELDLKTGIVALTPVYSRYVEDEIREIRAYRANITLRIRTKDLKASARILDAALKAGVNQVESVSFALKEVLGAREEALHLATQAARRKAEVMAEALGQRLGRTIGVTETTQNYGFYQGNRMSQSANIAPSGGGGAGVGDAVESGQVEITVDVSLSFALMPAK
ncbi:SIMPL domain-containing protein [soil metagenome]